MRFAPLALMLCVSSAMSAESVAHFSNFEYIGNDDFYNRNQLKSETEFYNPIIPGWNSDPSIVRVGNDYWLVVSTFGYFPGVPLYHSTDLAHWEMVRNILDRPSQLAGLSGQSLDKGGIYAPHISYNKDKERFYMVTTDVGKKQGHFYVTASDPSGDWSDPVFLNGIDGIDPSFFFDEDGKAYIVYKEDTTNLPKWSPYRCIRFIEFDVEKGQTVGESWPLYEPDVAPDEHLDRAEGPHLYKVNGNYYLLTAEGGTGDQHSANIYRAPAIRGPWQRSWRNPILTQRTLKPKRSNPVTCTGHADLVETPEGDWWAVFLGQRPGPGGFQALGRETFLMPVKWSKDGFPYVTQAMDTVPWILNKKDVKTPKTPSSGNFTWTDKFTTSNLRPEWIGLRGSTENLRTTGDGALHLSCSTEKSTGNGIPAYVGRRIQHHAFTVTTTMDFTPENNTELAGILMVKNETSQLFLASDGEKLHLIRYSKGKPETLFSTPLLFNTNSFPQNNSKESKVKKAASKKSNSKGNDALGGNKPVNLKISSDGILMTFSYQYPGSDQWNVLADGIDASIISCDRTGGFTGATIGMYAVSQ